MQIKFWVLIIGTIVACAILNRVRGGGFGGDKLPGRPIIYVAPIIGAITLFYADWVVALLMTITYLIWGIPAWGHTMAQLGDYRPNRPMTGLEELLNIGYIGAVIRMMFVLPGTAAIAFYLKQELYTFTAVVFALLATHAYKFFQFNIKDDSWQNAEIASGAIWGATLIVPLLAFAAPMMRLV